MKELEKTTSRRKFMTMGASSAAVLLGSAALSTQANTLPHVNTEQVKGNIKNYATINKMKADKTLRAGQFVTTQGYHQVNDNGGNTYQIVNKHHFEDGGSYIHLPNTSLTAKAIFTDGIIRAEQYGIVGVNKENNTQYSKNNTVAMALAHKTGNVIHYDTKFYHFNQLIIPNGGIIGKGDKTVFIAALNNSNDLITYQGNKIGKHNNTALFQNFTLKINSSLKKDKGVGIKLAKGAYNAEIKGVNITDLPIAIAVNNTLNYYIEGCTLSNYESCGILLHPNKITNNTSNSKIIHNTLNSSQKFAKAIKVHNNNVDIAFNHIVGGEIGIEINASNTFAATISENTIAEQSLHNVYLHTEAKKLNKLNTQFLLSQNKLSAIAKGAAINIEPLTPLHGSVSINNNIIRFNGDEQAQAAITVENTTGFTINHNTINCEEGKGYRGIYIAQNCNSGILSANNVILPLNGHTLNLSVTTKEA